MDTKVSYCTHLPHDGLAFSFIKFLENVLTKTGLELNFERMDPGGVDVYRYEAKDGRSIMITRTQTAQDMDEIKISSQWNGLAELVDRAADAFGNDVAQKIKQGRQKGCSCC